MLSFVVQTFVSECLHYAWKESIGRFPGINVSNKLSRIKGGRNRQLFPQKLVLFTDTRRHLNGNSHIKVATLAGSNWQPFASDA